MPFVNLNKIKLFYEETGSGEETIIFIHGLGSCGKDWKKQVDIFSKNYRCITVDLRGHGKSDHTPPFNIQTMAFDIINLIKFLEIKQIHLVGISLGGMIAFQIAVLEPKILKSLTIVNALPEFKLKGLKQNWMFFSRIFIINLLGMKIFSKILSKKLFPQKDQQKLREDFIKSFLKNNKQSYLSTLRSLMGWSVVKKIHLITCRTLFISAEHDYTSLSAKKVFAKKIGAKVIEIKYTHHALTIENPAEFNLSLQNFLNG